MVVLRRVKIEKFSDRCWVVYYGDYAAVIAKEKGEYELCVYEKDKEQKDAMNLIYQEELKTMKEALFVAGLIIGKLDIKTVSAKVERVNKDGS